MKTKETARRLRDALRQIAILDGGGRHDADHPREADAALMTATNEALAAWQALAVALKHEYPHSAP